MDSMLDLMRRLKSVGALPYGVTIADDHCCSGKACLLCGSGHLAMFSRSGNITWTDTSAAFMVALLKHAACSLDLWCLLGRECNSLSWWACAKPERISEQPVWHEGGADIEGLIRAILLAMEG